MYFKEIDIGKRIIDSLYNNLFNGIERYLLLIKIHDREGWALIYDRGFGSTDFPEYYYSIEFNKPEFYIL